LRLPTELLARVLLELPLNTRMHTASVSKAWRAAVAATVTSLHYRKLSEERLKSLTAWVATQGSHLTSLMLRGRMREHLQPILRQLQLPPGTSQLQQLTLQGLELQLGPGNSNIITAGVLPGLSCVTKLQLNNINRILDGSAGLQALSALTGLQNLQVHTNTLMTFPDETLSKLVQLTKLQLCGMDVPAPALRGLSLLSGLQQLDLRSPQTSTPFAHAALSNIPGLPQLTALLRTTAAISNDSTPGFSALTALQVLAV
jgi:hypothetical protein